MLYSEFLSGTGCRDNEKNYTVYKRVEQIYNNDNNMTHEEAYEIAKMWIDNSLTEEEEAHNNDVHKQLSEIQSDCDYWKQQIRNAKATIKSLKEEITRYQEYIKIDNATIEALQASIIK